MPKATIRFTSFPRTEAPPEFIPQVVAVFEQHRSSIATTKLKKGLTSDKVLQLLRNDLLSLGFEIEAGKKDKQRIERPVFFGEGGIPELQYHIDGYQPEWRCGLEIEAGRAWMGNAFYRDLIQAMVMIRVDHLCIAIPIRYVYRSNRKRIENPSYDNTIKVADALYGHTRLQVPYGLTIIGY